MKLHVLNENKLYNAVDTRQHKNMKQIYLMFNYREPLPFSQTLNGKSADRDKLSSHPVHLLNIG